MTDIIYSKLNRENFSKHSLDEFIRYQTANEVWLPENGAWTLRTIHPPKVWSWDVEQCRQTARTILNGICNEGFAYGAFAGGKVVGYIYITGQFWGSSLQYTELKLYHISAPYRRMGVGRELFRLGCEAARNIGAKKLYISANNSKESQIAYRKLGCVDSAEINPKCVEREPYDVQMEYTL